MSSAENTEQLPKSKESVVKKDPLPVVESPQKKVVLVKEKSQEEISSTDKEKQTDMEVDLTEDNVISPDNQT